MENLLKNLQEQQHHLQQQHLELHDLSNMEYANDREPPIPPRRKYVSIFRIDGEPILPPLMTTEKCRQMQKIKEKALKVEQRLRERRQRVNKENGINNDDMVSETSRSSIGYPTGNVSQRSQDYYEAKLKESEESLLLLQNFVKRQEEDKPAKQLEMACSTTKSVNFDENQEKLQKLQKSEILIYDNSTNKVIQLPPELETKFVNDQQSKLMDIERKANLNALQPKKPSHLLLAGVDGKGVSSIPSICLNPPTPLVSNRNICDNLSPIESNESLINSENQNISDDISSDESFNSMLTHTGGRPTKIQSKHLKHNTQETFNDCTKSQDKKSNKKIMNVSNKIQQFEALSSETTNSPQTSPEKFYQPRKSCLEAVTTAGNMSRSATSPSIKLTSSSNRSSSLISQSLIGQDSDNSPENTLVRSSSFTLEGPSKALIDHMRQQKSLNKNKSAAEAPLNTTRTITRKPINSPLRAHRDTVESKAKKVQKVELKSSKQKIQQKTSQSKLAQAAAAAASLSPYNSTSITQHSTSLYKTKKSPYETIKKSPPSMKKSTSSPSSSHMRKTVTTPTNIVQPKPSKSRVLHSPIQTPTSTSQNSAKSSTEKDSFSQMDKMQKEKFLRLLAQQDEEHRRLQQSFEMQQKMLMEQLNKEMATTQLKSPTNSINSSSTSSSQVKQNQVQHSPLTALNRFDHHHSQSQQQQSPTLSNHSSDLSMSNTQSQTVIAHHNSSFSSHCISSQSTPAIPNLSNLSSMDHSNANTSLDLSTLSYQTSPDTLCAATPTNIQTSHNMSGNKNSSSSRRRLFTPDVTVVEEAGSKKTLSSRSPASSSYPSLHRESDNGQLQQNQNKSSMGLTQNGSNRRPYQLDVFVLHAAATKINACARGFLVRRLFQTEQIQRIVQTIRDTLIFVLNLHMETFENAEESNTPANIKLKARLLQQLSSACRTLHLVFFQTSIKERMEIIARDRKRIKTKLLSINRKRIAG